MSEEEFAKLDHILVEGTQKGQSVEHIVHAHNLKISPRTIRNYISEGLTTVKALDTPRGASYKPRNKLYSREQRNKLREKKLAEILLLFLIMLNPHHFSYLPNWIPSKEPNATKTEPAC